MTMIGKRLIPDQMADFVEKAICSFEEKITKTIKAQGAHIE